MYILLKKRHGVADKCHCRPCGLACSCGCSFGASLQQQEGDAMVVKI